MDYIPSNGFHHKPSQAWPPLNADEYAALKEQASKSAKSGDKKKIKSPSAETGQTPNDPEQPPETNKIDVDPSVEGRAETTYLSINIDGERIVIKDQIQVRFFDAPKCFYVC